MAEEPRKGRAVSEDGRFAAIALLAIGMTVQGLSKSARQPFVGTYIDDNVHTSKTTLYLGKKNESIPLSMHFVK